MSGRKRVQPLHQGLELGDAAKHQVVLQRRPIELAGNRATAQERPDLRGEQQTVRPRSVEIERFDAEGIAAQKGALALLVKQTKGEHAPQLRQRCSALADQEPQEHLGVAC